MEAEGNSNGRRFASFLENPGLFDNKLFKISVQEATYMDPQQRLLLQSCYGVCQHGEISAPELPFTAVTVGVSYNEYFLNLMHAENTFSATSGTLSVISGRISYVLGLKGPSLSIDTACSSSLVGVHLSKKTFLDQGSRYTLSCGVNLILKYETTSVLTTAGMLCPDGRCKTLDMAADGYGRAESCIVHLLSNNDSKRNGNDVATCLLHGSAVGQDGASSSLTAPNGPAQQDVVRNALASASSCPTDIYCLEMHGTGTALGDPIEIGAFCKVIEGHRELPFFIQASKTAKAHSEPAAGAAGMLAITERLSMTSNQYFTTLRSMNPYVQKIYENHRKESPSTEWTVHREPGPIHSV